MPKLLTRHKNDVDNASKDVKGRIDQGSDRVKDIVDEGSSRAKETVSRGSKMARDKLDKGSSMAKDKLDKGSSVAKDRLDKGSSVAKDKLSSAGGMAQDRLDTAKSWASDHVPHRKKKRHPLRTLFIGLAVISGAFAVFKFVKDSFGGKDEWAPSNYPAGMPGNDSQPSYNGVTSSSGVGTMAGMPAMPDPDKKPRPSEEKKLDSFLGMDVEDIDGSSIGEVKRIYYRDRAWEPEWAVVSSGLLDNKEVLVALEDATIDEKIHASYPKDLIEKAPVFSEPVVTDEEEIAAYSHYNIRRELAAEVRADDDVLRVWSPEAEHKEE